MVNNLPSNAGISSLTPDAAKSLQSCPTLCDPIDGSPLGSPVPWILQARTLEWVAISFSSAWKWKLKVKSLSRVQLFATPWTAAYQAPPSMGFSRQEYWSGVPSPSPKIPHASSYWAGTPPTTESCPPQLESACTTRKETHRMEGRSPLLKQRPKADKSINTGI